MQGDDFQKSSTWLEEMDSIVNKMNSETHEDKGGEFTNKENGEVEQQESMNIGYAEVGSTQEGIQSINTMVDEYNQVRRKKDIDKE